jgi:hypothetical protein
MGWVLSRNHRMMSGQIGDAPRVARDVIEFLRHDDVSPHTHADAYASPPHVWVEILIVRCAEVPAAIACRARQRRGEQCGRVLENYCQPGNPDSDSIGDLPVRGAAHARDAAFMCGRCGAQTIVETARIWLIARSAQQAA